MREARRSTGMASAHSRSRRKAVEVVAPAPAKRIARTLPPPVSFVSFTASGGDGGDGGTVSSPESSAGDLFGGPTGGVSPQAAAEAEEAQGSEARAAQAVPGHISFSAL